MPLPQIILPGGYAPEEGKVAGDTVRALIELRLGEDGTANIVSLDGAAYDAEEAEKEMGEEGEVEKEDLEDDEMDASSEAFGSRLEAAMGGMA